MNAPPPAMPALAATNPLFAAALGYAARGWPVLPCWPRGKTPLTKQGLTDATTDERQLRAWWTRWPAANVAIATGHQLLVVDVDPRHGGDRWLRAARVVGLTRPARVALTGSDGVHLYYRLPADVEIRNSASRLACGVDVRGRGGYIIAPPSLHPNGQPYRWATGAAPDELELLPAALLARLQTPPAEAVSILENGAAAPPADRARLGTRALALARAKVAAKGRNEAGLWLCCQLRDNGFSETDAEAVLRLFWQAEAHNGDHPYTWNEATRSLGQTYRRAPRNPWTTTRPRPDPDAVLDALDAAPPPPPVSKLENAGYAPAVDPATGELAGEVDKDALIAALAAELAQERTRREQAEARLAAGTPAAPLPDRTAVVVARERWVRRLYRLPHVLPAALRVAYALRQLVDAGKLPASETGWRRLEMKTLAAWTACSPRQAGHYVQVLAGYGWLERVEHRVGLEATEIRVRLHPACLGDDPRGLPLPTPVARGGPRPRTCAVCGKRTLQPIIWRCRRCGTEQDGGGHQPGAPEEGADAAVSTLESAPAPARQPTAPPNAPPAPAQTQAALEERLPARAFHNGKWANPGPDPPRPPDLPPATGPPARAGP